MIFDIMEGSTAKIILTIDNPDGELPDLSTASEMQIIVKYPDKTKKTYVGVLYTDGSDWKIYALTAAADFDQDDVYYVRAHIEYSGGLEYNSEYESFTVGGID
jgi:hypothetical protein